MRRQFHWVVLGKCHMRLYTKRCQHLCGHSKDFTTLKKLSNLLLSSTGTTSKSFPLELTFLPSLSSVVLAGALSSSLSVLLSLSSLSLSSLSLNRFFFACLGFSSIPLLVPCCCSPKSDSEFLSRIKNTFRHLIVNLYASWMNIHIKATHFFLL